MEKQCLKHARRMSIELKKWRRNNRLFDLKISEYKNQTNKNEK